MKKKVDFEVGKKVRGYGLLNEYGEFEFTPEATGSRQGQMKTIKSTDTYDLRTTRNLLIVHIRIPKVKGFKLIQTLLTTVNELITDLRNYEV